MHIWPKWASTLISLIIHVDNLAARNKIVNIEQVSFLYHKMRTFRSNNHKSNKYWIFAQYASCSQKRGCLMTLIVSKWLTDWLIDRTIFKTPKNKLYGSTRMRKMQSYLKGKYYIFIRPYLKDVSQVICKWEN